MVWLCRKTKKNASMDGFFDGKTVGHHITVTPRDEKKAQFLANSG
jgi:hypothetical protein